MSDLEKSMRDILLEVDTMQHRLTLHEVEDRKKFMVIQDGMFAIKQTLEEMIKKLEEQK